jgi:hypothetical protein
MPPSTKVVPAPSHSEAARGRSAGLRLNWWRGRHQPPGWPFWRGGFLLSLEAETTGQLPRPQDPGGVFLRGMRLQAHLPAHRPPPLLPRAVAADDGSGTLCTVVAGRRGRLADHDALRRLVGSGAGTIREGRAGEAASASSRVRCIGHADLRRGCVVCVTPPRRLLHPDPAHPIPSCAREASSAASSTSAIASSIAARPCRRRTRRMIGARAGAVMERPSGGLPGRPCASG